jgi:hypothetical protein
MKRTFLNIKKIDWSRIAQAEWSVLKDYIKEEYGNKALLTTYNDQRSYGRRIKFKTHPNVNRDEVIGFIKGKGHTVERHSQGYILVYLGSFELDRNFSTEIFD